jgi:enoyl-CoA hydratase/carnithine racemase
MIYNRMRMQRRGDMADVPSASDATQITVSRHDAVAVVQFSNAPAGVLTTKGAHMLRNAVTALVVDPGTRVIVITGGQPGIFVRHYDLNSILKAGESVKSGSTRPEDFLASPFAALTDLIASCEKPVIAAINGTCMGGGLELALACDIRIASATVTRIGLPEILLDIFPGGGGTQRLTRTIGESAALDMILRGRTVDAMRAYALGLVHDVVEDALTYALAVAHAMAKCEAGALGAAKRLVRRASQCSLDAGLADERMGFATLMRDNARSLETIREIVDSGTALEGLSQSVP